MGKEKRVRLNGWGEREEKEGKREGEIRVNAFGFSVADSGAVALKCYIFSLNCLGYSLCDVMQSLLSVSLSTQNLPGLISKESCMELSLSPHIS